LSLFKERVFQAVDQPQGGKKLLREKGVNRPLEETDDESIVQTIGEKNSTPLPGKRRNETLVTSVGEGAKFPFQAE